MQQAINHVKKIGSQHTSTNSRQCDGIGQQRVKRLFALLQANYGVRWKDQTGTGDALRLSMQVWDEKLAGITDEQIKFGLDNLPEDFTPTPAKFKSLCKNNAGGLSHNTAAYLPFARDKQLPAPKNKSLARKKLAEARRILAGARSIEQVAA